jgi:hypothetical protein
MTKISALLFACVLLSLTAALPPKVEITFGNRLFTYTISTVGDRIRPVSYRDNELSRQLLCENGAPYFRFAVNGAIVTSDDPIWRFRGTDSQSLPNGGTQITSRFEGRGKARGLELEIDHQYFPASALVRERLRMRSVNGARMRLTNVEGRNLFIFPSYSFRAAGRQPSTEIRMATYNSEVVEDFDRDRTWDNRPSRNLAGCHMFHPDVIEHPDDRTAMLKGPFAVVPIDGHIVLTSYEHASQDKAPPRGGGDGVGALTDPSQGVKGELGYVPTDDDFWFIATRVERARESRTVSQRILRGGYLDGEAVPGDGEGYRSVWSTINFLPEGGDYQAAIRHYVLNQITSHPPSRTPVFYYNTWGMQRDSQSEGMELREIFNRDRILEEIDHAAQLDVDVVVLDDGWEEAMGVWTPHSRKLPGGFAPLIERMR